MLRGGLRQTDAALSFAALGVWSILADAGCARRPLAAAIRMIGGDAINGTGFLAARGAIMSRYAARMAPFLIAAVLILTAACGNREQTLLSNEEQQGMSLPMRPTYAENLIEWGRQGVCVAISEEKYVSGILDPWTSSIIVSMLPEGAQERLAAVGLVFVDDEEAASAIGIVAGVGSSPVSGIWVGLDGSWGCIKCCYATPGCCAPCPACCEDKDGYVEMSSED